MTKQIIRVNASSLRESACLLRWKRTIVDGYYQGCSKASMVYGIAIHKYIDTMFKTGGDIRLARDKMLEAFRVPKSTPTNQQWLADEKHLVPAAFDVWDNLVMKDNEFDLIQLNSICWYCEGVGRIKIPDSGGTILETSCKQCTNGLRQQPATEVTFSVKFYEDDYCIVNLEGTIDKIGKIRKGCYAIGDYKTTSQWKVDEYLARYEMSAQLRFYVLALKLMAEQHPDSILGQIGSTKVGAFIDGIFLKAKVTDIEYHRSHVFQFKDDDLAQFRVNLLAACANMSAALQANTFTKQGIFNGSCEDKWGLCQYWAVCNSGNEILLSRDFKKKEYNPLKHNEV